MRTNPDIFANNLTALELRYPELAERVRHCKIVNYELFQQEGCIPNVRHTILNHTWYIGQMDKYLEQQWKGLYINNVKFPIFLGFGLGYDAQYFLGKYGPQFNIQGCIIIERDLELFTAALNVTDITELLSKPFIHFLVGIPSDDIYLAARDLFFKNIRDMLFCGTMYPIFTESPFKVDKNYYLKSLSKLMEGCWDSIHNFGNDPEDSLIGLENMLDNIAEIANNPGINLLYDKFKDKPAVIVATGPSLKKNIHLLKGLEDKALIISVDASLKLLLKNGIKPHMVTSLEREHEVQQFFDELDPEEVKGTYMTACPVLYNHVYRAYNGPKIIVYRQFDHFKWLGVDKGMLDIKLSSSNMAFKIAEALGCNPIILVGQDLAYGDNDETHATEVPFSSEGEAIFNVSGNYVDEIKTNDGWNNFRKAYEIDISQYKGTVINCTAGGALIKGTLIDSLQKIIDNKLQESFYPSDIIREGLSQFTAETIKKDIEHLNPLIDKTIEDLKSIVQLCEEGAKQDPSLPVSELLKNRSKIHTEYIYTFQNFLMHVIQSIHLAWEMRYAIKPQNPIEWYQYIGDITYICLQSLLKAKGDLSE